MAKAVYSPNKLLPASWCHQYRCWLSCHNWPLSFWICENQRVTTWGASWCNAFVANIWLGFSSDSEQAQSGLGFVKCCWSPNFYWLSHRAIQLPTGISVNQICPVFWRQRLDFEGACNAKMMRAKRFFCCPLNRHDCALQSYWDGDLAGRINACRSA